MRLRNVPGADAYLTAHPLVIKNETRYRGTWKETFQNPENPIHIEIGMGKGQFLLTLAKENPSINYIGIERYQAYCFGRWNALTMTRNTRMSTIFVLSVWMRQICRRFLLSERLTRFI